MNLEIVDPKSGLSNLKIQSGMRKEVTTFSHRALIEWPLNVPETGSSNGLPRDEGHTGELISSAKTKSINIFSIAVVRRTEPKCGRR